MILPAALCIAVLVAAGLYLLLGRSMQRAVLGLMMLGNGVNLTVLTCTRQPSHAAAPILGAGGGPVVDPLPQAFLLTAIVIGLGTAAFLLVLAVRAARGSGRDGMDG